MTVPKSSFDNEYLWLLIETIPVIPVNCRSCWWSNKSCVNCPSSSQKQHGWYLC